MVVQIRMVACCLIVLVFVRTWLDFVYFSKQLKLGFHRIWTEILNELQWTWSWSLSKNKLLPVTLIIFRGLKCFGSIWNYRVFIKILCVICRVGLHERFLLCLFSLNDEGRLILQLLIVIFCENGTWYYSICWEMLVFKIVRLKFCILFCPTDCQFAWFGSRRSMYCHWH